MATIPTRHLAHHSEPETHHRARRQRVSFGHNRKATRLPNTLLAAALLLALLGLGRTPLTSATGPFVYHDLAVPSNSIPALLDIDADGDLDAFVGAGDGRVYGYRNVGNAASPRFSALAGAANPLGMVDVKSMAAPAFADIDADGDYDAFIGSYNNGIQFFRNTGTASAPAFVQETGPMGDLPLANPWARFALAFADLDGDGDLDAAVSKGLTIVIFENTGTAVAPRFREITGPANPLAGYQFTPFPTPSFADLDQDGRPDLIAGDGKQRFKLLRNLSRTLGIRFGEETRASPFLDMAPGISIALADIDADADLDAFVGQQDGQVRFLRADNPYEQLSVVEERETNELLNSDTYGEEPRPALVDIDADGDLDAFVGMEDGTILFARNRTSTLTPTLVVEPQHNALAGFDMGDRASPTFVDLDADGDYDVVVGCAGDRLRLFRNIGSASAPLFVAQSGTDSPLSALDVIGTAQPTFVDLDADGDQDLFVGASDGRLHFFRNVGTAHAPSFVAQQGPGIPFDGVVWQATPSATFVDADGDQDLDAYIISESNWVLFYRNVDGAASPTFRQENGHAFMDVGFAYKLAVADLDLDGDLDALLGLSFDDGDGFPGLGRVWFYRNTGVSARPGFIQQPGSANPFKGVQLTGVVDLEPVDIDADGDRDIFLGRQDGTVRFLRNTGTTNAPQFVEQSGAANPLGAIIVAGAASPAFVDIDGDGDQDLFLGALNGMLRFYRNTGSASAPVFALASSDNPFADLDVGDNAEPSFADLDADGDQDAVITRLLVRFSTSYRTFHYFQNSGGATSPIFGSLASSSTLWGPSSQTSGALNFFDGDGDGDLDALVPRVDGSNGAIGSYVKNEGTPTSPSFSNGYNESPLTALYLGSNTLGAIADLNGDTVIDAIVALPAQQSIQFFEGVTQTTATMVYQRLSSVPLSTHKSFSLSLLELVDIDGDGDQDAFASDQHLSGQIFFRNAGAGGTIEEWSGDPLALLQNPYMLAFVDIDADLDPDLFVTNAEGLLHLYLNTGTPQSPAYVKQSDEANPLAGVAMGAWPSARFADLDDDDDQDLVVSTQDKPIQYYRNTGTAQSASFSQQSGADNPFAALPAAGNDITLFDFDFDGDQDLFRETTSLKEPTSGIAYMQNVGSASAPSYVAVAPEDNPLSHLLWSRPVFADIDNDGNTDMFLAHNGIRFFRWRGRVAVQRYSQEFLGTFEGLTVASRARPALGDIDGDGDQDLLTGASNGAIAYFLNSGTPLSPAFVEQEGAQNPLGAAGIAAEAAPSLVDIDADGDLDSFVGTGQGELAFFRNTGGPQAPAFAQISGGENPFHGVDVGTLAAPDFVDIDADGDYDALVGRGGGTVVLYRNDGSATLPAFSAAEAADNPLGSITLAGHAVPAFVDVDGDGDQDVYIGCGDGTLHFYHNTGSAQEARFEPDLVAAAVLPQTGVGYAVAAFADLDGDADQDALVAAEMQGTGGLDRLRFLENQNFMPAPGGLAVTAREPTSIGLSWSDPTQGTSGFSVERLAGTTWVTVGTTPAGVTTYLDERLMPGQGYSYRVRTFDGVLRSLPSPPLQATTKPAVYLPLVDRPM